MELVQIPRVDKISKEDFIRSFVKPQQPVVITGITHDWPAFEKWDLDYISKLCGDKTVPLYDDRPVSHRDGFNEPHHQMLMKDYVDLLKSQPTNYRIFLYNLMKEVPGLQADFRWPDLGIRLVKQLPMLFFGGAGSKVFMHFDIDYANILHFHFHGRKRCVIFAPDQSKYLYKVPHSLISREDIDFDQPDYSRFPALKRARGYVTELAHGEMLYMPEGYWHYMKYMSPGFSMSLRAFPKSPQNLVMAAYNVFVMRNYDVLMRKWKGEEWIRLKNEKAVDQTHSKLGITG